MARPRLISEEFLIEAAESYIEEECKGNIPQFKYAHLTKYIVRRYNISVKDHQIRRCKALVDYIDKKKQQEIYERKRKILIYENLNVEDFVKHNNTTAKLKNALLQRDLYYKNIYEYSLELLDENQKLNIKMKKLSENLEKIKNVRDNQDYASAELQQKFHEAEEKIKILQNIIKTYVYPEIANKLLEEKGLLKLPSSPISENGLNNIIRAKDEIVKTQDKESNNAIIQDLFDSI